ncbi:MAG TPA: efflux RND transporter periplasmic adaptor subunit [Stellaceae bacterium]|nr:efflux RND transporter periplasmic adaptor subunit [Stellaceae bacterium]
MRKRVIAALAVVAVAGAALLPLLLPPSAPAGAAEKPRAAGPPVPVTAGVVATADVPVLLNAIGTVQAANMVTIRSRVDGQIVKVDFTEGQEVAAGAPLFQIDPRPYQAALDQAKAAKAKDEAQLASAQLDLARYGQLVGSGYQTRQSYDQQKAQVAQLQAAIQGDAAAIETANINLGYTDIRAPIAGRLGARLVDKGNLVRAADTTGLVTIAQVRPIFVSFTLPQNTLNAIRDEQAKSPLPVDAYGDDLKRLLGKGQLTLIDNNIDQATGTIHLKASFANTEERLWPGEFVNVRVVLSVRKGVPTVPAETVQEGPQGHFAYVIKKDGTVERRAVKITVMQGGVAVIGKGLSPGEKVVVDGQFRLIDGARVRVTSPKSGAAGGAAG